MREHACVRAYVLACVRVRAMHVAMRALLPPPRRVFSCASKNHVDQILPSVKLNIFIDFHEKNLTRKSFRGRLGATCPSKQTKNVLKNDKL